MTKVDLYYETVTNLNSSNPSILDVRFGNRTYVNVRKIAIVGYSVPRMLLDDQFIRLYLPEFRKDWPVSTSEPYKFIRGNKYYPMEYCFKPVLHALNKLEIQLNDSRGVLLDNNDYDNVTTVSMIIEIECEDVKLQS